MTVTAKVCVVGAGPAGLAMARALKTAGLAFDVFERNPDVGGIWSPDHVGSPMYDSAHFISSKGAETSTFRGHPFSECAAVYPSHADVLAYLKGFAEAENLYSHIRFSTPVDSISRESSAWRVTAGGTTSLYKSVVCASGTLWDPIIPELPGAERFDGHVRHSATYRSADEVRGKRVLVVGAGNSGVDIACDAARTAASVSISLRRGYWFVPKFIAGQPTDMFFRSRDGLPDWAHPPDAASLLKLLVGAPESYGLPAPDHAPFASHPIMNSEILHHLGHGRIKPRAAIKRLEGSDVVYIDGKREAVDEIVLATGYTASVPYLPKGTFEYGGGNRPRLWMRMVHPDNNGLYGLGFLETNSSVYRLFDLGAELIARHIKAVAECPTACTALDKAIAEWAEPNLDNGLSRIASSRHIDYVDSRAYEDALQDLIATHFSQQ